MPKYTETQEARLRQIIRDATAIDPLITVRGLQAVTEKKLGRPLDLGYIIKLQRKVRGEIKIRPDRERYEDRLSFLRERNRVICAELFRIAFPDPNSLEKPGVIDRRKALEAISRIEKDMIKLEMDLGLFTRQIGTINVDHRLKPMSQEALMNSAAAFKAWGVSPPQMRKIEPVRIVDVETTNKPHEPATTKPEPNKQTSQPITTIGRAGLVPTE